MKNQACAFALLLFCTLFFSSAAFAQSASGEGRGKQIKNLISEVKRANPGDYIVLKSGKKYVLTQKDIDIANGRAQYNDLSDVKTETRSDGTEIKTISEAHIAYKYKDGQSTHVLKTGISFAAFRKDIEKNYHLTQFVDWLDDYHASRKISPPRFEVFRASVQFQSISNGVEELESITITAYNYKGENYVMKYCSAPDMIWGHISSEGSYSPVGEARQVEFDVE
jgi:hypothetical protein